MRNFLLAAVSLVFFCQTSSYSQINHYRPVNIADWNEYEAIFIGKILCHEEGEIFTTVFVEVEEELKFRDHNCQLALKTRDPLPDYHLWESEEQWLIFVLLINGEYYFSLSQSTGIYRYRTYSPKLIQQDLAFLRDLAIHPTQTVKKCYQVSWMGCRTNDDFYIAMGELEDGFPHGQWIYCLEDGTVVEEGTYMDGTKWGEWFRYFDNGMLGERVTYDNGHAIKWLQYDSEGELYCFNGDCFMWTGWGDTTKTISYILPHEKQGFIREKLML